MIPTSVPVHESRRVCLLRLELRSRQRARRRRRATLAARYSERCALAFYGVYRHRDEGSRYSAMSTHIVACMRLKPPKRSNLYMPPQLWPFGGGAANLTSSSSSAAVPPFRHTSRRQRYELAHGRSACRSRSQFVRGSWARPCAVTISSISHSNPISRRGCWLAVLRCCCCCCGGGGGGGACAACLRHLLRPRGTFSSFSSPSSSSSPKTHNSTHMPEFANCSN